MIALGRPVQLPGQSRPYRFRVFPRKSGVLRGRSQIRDVVLFKRLDPTRRIASNHHFFVVDARIFVGLLVSKDGIDRSRQLVGGGDDGSFAA